MPTELPKLEQFLEQLGSKETPGDTRHRYALRRALLNSSVFESNRVAARWYHVWTVTSSVVTGGVVVAVIVVSVVSWSGAPDVSVAAASAEDTVEVADDVQPDDQYRDEQVLAAAAPSEEVPAVSMAAFSDLVPVEPVVHFMRAPIDFAISR